MRTVLVLLLAAAAVEAQTDVRELLEKKTLDRIAQLDRETEGTLGVAAIDLSTGRTFTYNANTIFPTASSIKVPVMVELFRDVRAGKLRLDQEVPVAKSDLVDSSFRTELLLRRGPANFTLRELIEAMIEVSDNTAANKLIELAGMDRVNHMLDELGLPNTRLRRKMMDWHDTDHRENISTPIEMTKLMEAVYHAKACHEQDCAAILKIMKRVEADFRKVVPGKIDVAAKPGEIPGALCETGIVFLPSHPFALTVMSAYVPASKDPVPEAAAIVYSMFEKLATSNRYGHRLE